MPNNEGKEEKRSTERVVEYVTEKSKGINWTNIILPVGAVFLGYEFLKSQGVIKPIAPPSTQITPECPRGKEYHIDFYQSCDAGYLETRPGWYNFPFAGALCVCEFSSGTAVSLDTELPYKRHQEYYPGIPPGSQNPSLPVGISYRRNIATHQSNYNQFPTNDLAQLSLDKWQPLSKQEKLKLGIVRK